MDNTRNLFKQFHGSEIDPAELHQLLLQRFHGALEPNLGDVVYPGDETQYALKICIRDEGIADILQGPKLTTADLDCLERAIATELLESSGAQVASTILFSNLPVDGWFRYRDVLQILPAPDDAPRAGFLLADHPFMLQFAFPTSSNWLIRNLRAEKKGREIRLVLTGLLAGDPHSLTETSIHHWVILPNESGGSLRAEYLQEGYVCPNLPGYSDDFISALGFPQLPEVEAAEYYSRWAISAESRFDVPIGLAGLFDTFFGLSANVRCKFVRACFWFDLSGKVHAHSRSAAFGALVNAIESLMPPEEKSGSCKECGRSKGKGITSRFTEFLNQMVPGEESDSRIRRNLYGLRSALTHGSHLLASDHLPLDPGPEFTSEFADVQEAQYLVRQVMVNWLHGQGAGQSSA